MQTSTHKIRKRKRWAMVDGIPDVSERPSQQGRDWMCAVSMQRSAGGSEVLGSSLQAVDGVIHLITKRHND